MVELGHHLGEGALGIGDGAFRVELTLLLEAAFAFRKFFSVEIRNGVEDRVVRLRR
jgi:hypothetical protein